MRLHKQHLLFLAGLLSLACSRHIYPDRSQFLQDGDPVPIVDLSTYKSVQQRPGQDPELAAALAISGGGSRAANFATGIMLGLEEILITPEQDALDQVDYLSTVSGGGFAAGAYIAALFDHQAEHPDSAFTLEEHWEAYIKEALLHSYTGVLLRAKFNPRFWFSFIDDGDALEKAIDDQVLGYKRRDKDKNHPANRSIVLGDIFIPKDSTDTPVQLPMHFSNSSVLNTWSIFPYAPDILEEYQITGYTHQLKTMKPEPFDPYQAPLAVGIKASGSFPVLISNSTLHSDFSSERPYLHLIDGAMTDNIGYYTALEILKQDSAARKVLMIIDADAGGHRYTFSKRRGAIYGVNVYAQLPISGMDAQRVRLEKDLQDIGPNFGITPIFFSYHMLIRNNDAKCPEKCHVKNEMNRLIALMSKDLNAPTPTDMQILYDLVTNIDTKYTMTEEEQALLVLAGRKLVHMQKEEVLEAMKGGSE